jgi:hypothetical protein
MNFKIRGPALAAMLLPALALAVPAFAQSPALGLPIGALNDSEEPGSVIIFPKFIRGTVTLPEPGGATVPRSELEIGIVCPKRTICPEHMPVKLRFHWVCPGSDDPATKFICKETDFDINATVFEKIVLTPDGIQVGPGLPTKIAPRAECPRGFLIGWVISPSNDKPISFNGLVGDAVLRGTATADPPPPTPFALAAYNAIPIQAVNPVAGTPVVTNNNGALLFDGADNHYKAISGRIFGDVRYTTPAANSFSAVVSEGSLTLLTLDVISNRPNYPTFVDLDFFGGNPSTIGNENQLSSSWHFICWDEVLLTDIDVNLVSSFMGRKGVFVSDAAQKVAIFGVTDHAGPVTLLGLFETTEGPLPFQRAYYNNLFNDSNPVATRFRPGPSPIFLP